MRRRLTKKISGAPKENLSRLTTEQTNRASADLDLKSSLEIVRVINDEDAKVVGAVRRALPQIARAVELIANAMQSGGQADLRRCGDQRQDCGSRRGGVSADV